MSLGALCNLLFLIRNMNLLKISVFLDKSNYAENLKPSSGVLLKYMY